MPNRRGDSRAVGSTRSLRLAFIIRIRPIKARKIARFPNDLERLTRLQGRRHPAIERHAPLSRRKARPRAAKRTAHEQPIARPGDQTTARPMPTPQTPCGHRAKARSTDRPPRTPSGLCSYKARR